MNSQRRAKIGDIIELVPQKYVSDEVWVESLTDNQFAVKFQSGSLAILVEKRRDAVVVMTETGFTGWVFNDEWRCTKA